MKNLFIPYDLSLRLKEKGFNEHCFGIYYDKDGNVRQANTHEYGDSPLYQQVVDWLREKNKFHIIIANLQSEFNGKWSFTVSKDNVGVIETLSWGIEAHYCKTYHEALNKAIEEVLKLI